MFLTVWTSLVETLGFALGAVLALSHALRPAHLGASHASFLRDAQGRADKVTAAEEGAAGVKVVLFVC